MKLWLDDTREPEVCWVWARTARCAITLLRGGNVEHISFAPDRRGLVSEVVDWMIENEVHPERRTVHRRDGGAKKPRAFLQIRRQAS